MFVLGCNPVLEPITVSSSDVKAIAASMEDVSKEDAEVIYKQFAGIAAYVKHCKKTVKTTAQLEQIISKFHNDYSYEPGQYEEFDAAFKKFMKARGYDKEKFIVERLTKLNSPEEGKQSNPYEIDGKIVLLEEEVEITRSQLIDDMQTIADGAKLALSKKK